MTSEYQPSPELDELVAAATEGALDDGAAARLNAMLQSDADARAFYVDYIEVHALLHWRHGTVEPLELPLAAPASTAPPLGAAPYIRTAMAAAGCLALAALVIILVTGGPPGRDGDPSQQPIAIVVDNENVQWKTESLLDGEQQLRPGRQRIAAGVARIELSSGVLLAAAGPVDFEITSSDRIHLHQGKLHVYSPLAARGFTVTTPRGVPIVDLGTRFGVWVREDESVHVHLFEGRLRVNNEHDLVENQAVTVDRHGQLHRAESDGSLFPPLHRQ